MPAEAQEIEKIFRPLNDAERKFAPKGLFVQGDLDLLRKGVRVSIIGSREPSPQGLARARKLARLLIQRGIVIVSGLARGIDTAAHTAAIEGQGRTIGVLGTPLSAASPIENKGLQELIGQRHLLLSQFPVGKPVGKGNFPIRNRLMALISDATVIVEAKDGSGTAYQGREVIRLARPLWIPKSAVEDATLKWPKEFLGYGAQVLTEDSMSAFQDLLPERSEVNEPARVNYET